MEQTSSRKVMIRMQDIRKEYRLGQIGYGTLNRDLQSWWARRHHREDPNVRLGEENRLNGDILQAVSGVDLTVYRGECVGIIGGNGAGKSTLLKMIARVTTPTSGTMDLYGRVTSMLEVGTGFHGEMTGRENIYLNGAILGMNRKEIDAKLEQIIEFSEVRDFIDTPVKRYSSGMYVKLAFAVASHLDSEIVIMDEVLAVGDAGFQKKCIEKMRASAMDENRTVLYVSHNMDTVRRLCDRCIVMGDGKIRYDGNVEEAIRWYEQHMSSVNAQDQSLEAIVRRDKNISGLCRMTDLDLCEEMVSCHEELRFRLCLDARQDMDGVRVRMVVSGGADGLVGMAYSTPFSVERGKAWYQFSFPVDPLGPGDYVSDLVVFSFEGNVETRHDFLSRVLQFSVADRELHFGSLWNARNWGNVQLSTIRPEGPV